MEHTGEQWLGEFTIDGLDLEMSSEYVIELEDGTKGICSIELAEVQAPIGSPVTYHYRLKCTSPLK